MNVSEKKPANEAVLSALLESPFTFELAHVYYSIYPQTLGVSLLIGQEIEDLEINAQLLQISPITETIRLASQKAHVVARIIAFAVCRTKAEIFDANYFTNLVDVFECMSVEDRATILHYILTADHTQEIIKHFKIDDELRQLRKATGVKDNKNSLAFGGLSVFGSLIDWAAERYGWTYEYIVWGISYTALQLLQADQVRDVYLTDDELKKAHLIRPGDEVVMVDEMSYEEFVEKYKFD